MKKTRAIAVILFGAVVVSSCTQINMAKAKLGMGSGDPEEKVAIVASAVADKPLLFHSMVIPKGVFIGSVDVSRLTEAAAYQKLKQATDEYIRSGKLTINANGKSKTVDISTLKLNYDIEEALQQALSLRNKTVEEAGINLMTGEESAGDYRIISLKKSFEHKVIEDIVAEMGKDTDIKPEDDSIYVENGDIKIKKGKPGKGLNPKKILEEVSIALDKQQKEPVECKIEEIKPKEIKEEDIAKLTGVIGSSVTYYNEGNVDRSYNVKRATECFNNMVIMPGETISYNKITDIGGYRAALVINGNDELEMGVGGGLCQVATTLFQASVRAGLTIVESNNHTHPSEYTKLAMDAMVSGWSDLKVRNDFDFPVIIRCYAQGGENYYEILGDTEKKNYEVNLVAGEVSTVPMPVKEIEDPTVPYGKQVIEKEGSVGYNVATYIYNGKTGETYKLRDNHYTARTRVVRVNKGVPTNVENLDKWLEEYLKNLENQENGQALP